MVKRVTVPGSSSVFRVITLRLLLNYSHDRSLYTVNLIFCLFSSSPWGTDRCSSTMVRIWTSPPLVKWFRDTRFRNLLRDGPSSTLVSLSVGYILRIVISSVLVRLLTGLEREGRKTKEQSEK